VMIVFMITFKDTNKSDDAPVKGNEADPEPA